MTENELEEERIKYRDKISAYMAVQAEEMRKLGENFENCRPQTVLLFCSAASRILLEAVSSLALTGRNIIMDTGIEPKGEIFDAKLESLINMLITISVGYHKQYKETSQQAVVESYMGDFVEIVKSEKE